MAIPTTQKECTTRRIASLIIGLWGKVKNAFLLKTSRGAANGVASLDANGKVPSSQLPALYTYQGITVSSVSALINAIKSEKVAFGSLQFSNAAQFGNIHIYNNVWYDYRWVCTANNESYGTLDLFVGTGIDNTPRPCIRFIYDNGTLRNPMYLPCSYGSVGDYSTPVFVDTSGELKACTNIPVIEHVNTIPVNPTVGTIYAL